jgi:hypothetical protein
MHSEPVPQDPGRGDPQLESPDWTLVPCRPDWPDWMCDEAYLAVLAGDDDPGDLDLYQDPDSAPPPDLDDTQLVALMAEARVEAHASARKHAAVAELIRRRPARDCPAEGPARIPAAWDGNPKCRYDHRMKQDPRWKTEQLPGGHVRWTTPSGRQYTTEPTRYPI